MSLPCTTGLYFQISNSAAAEPVITNRSTNTNIRVSKFFPRIGRPIEQKTALTTMGICGTNNVSGEKPSPIFYQGEDVVFEASLYFQGSPIDPTIFRIYAVVKPTVYLDSVAWEGNLADGIFFNNTTGLYTIFIPATRSAINGVCPDTSYPVNDRCLTFPIAGDYQLDVYVQEISNNQELVNPVTALIGTQYFDIQYSVFSPLPETLEESNGDLARAALKQSGPFSWNQTVANSTYSWIN